MMYDYESKPHNPRNTCFETALLEHDLHEYHDTVDKRYISRNSH